MVKIPRNEIDKWLDLHYASRVSEHPQPPRQTPQDYNGPKAFRDHPGVATREPQRAERSEVMGVRPLVDEVESNGERPSLTEFNEWCVSQFADQVRDDADALRLASVSSGGAEITT